MTTNNNQFNNGFKAFNDMNNQSEGPHLDAITDLRNEIDGTEKTRVNPDGTIQGGTTQVGPIKLDWEI